MCISIPLKILILAHVKNGNNVDADWEPCFEYIQSLFGSGSGDPEIWILEFNPVKDGSGSGDPEIWILEFSPVKDGSESGDPEIWILEFSPVSNGSGFNSNIFTY